MGKEYDQILDLLKQNKKYVSGEDNSLLKNKLVEDAFNNDPSLIEMLYQNNIGREWFFTKLSCDKYVFNSEKFAWMISNKQLLPDSYTRFTQMIGLMLPDGRYCKQNHDVVLVFPFKDCILEGGQTKIDAKRNEVFFNKILMPEMIDTLMEPKVLINPIKHSSSGTEPIKKYDNDNLIIKGNNLLALSSLLRKYRGRIKCIYIDPPYYFVAKKAEDTFNYNSNFKLSTWLVFMKNRLELARELLSDDGAIFVQISDDAVAELHLLMKEIFNRPGENNFINKITVKTKSPSGFQGVNPGVFESAEYILAFAKNKKNWTYNTQYVKVPYDPNYKWYIKNKSDDYEKWEYVDISEFVAISNLYENKKQAIQSIGIDAFTKKVQEFALANASSVFRFTTINDNAGTLAIKAREESKNNNIILRVEREDQYTMYVTKGQEIAFYSKKIRIIDGEKVPSIQVSNIWTDTPYEGIAKEGDVTLKGGKKPEKLIRRIIEMATNEGDLVLDFFMGSGTTCAVAHKLRRQYIGIDQLDYGDNDAIHRLDSVINGDPTGISKAVGWTGGGHFISCELAKLGQDYIDKICTHSSNLNELYKYIQNSPYISERTTPKILSDKQAAFEQMSDEEKRSAIAEIFDWNQLFVNLSDMEDQEMSILEEDKEFNRSFYGDL